MKTLFLALRSAIYMSGFLLFFGWIALLVRTFDRSLGVSLPAAAEIPGAILLVAGATLGLACAGVFISRGRGTSGRFRFCFLLCCCFPSFICSSSSTKNLP
jgi:uncharacterized membrane protein